MLLAQDQQFTAQPWEHEPGERTVKMWIDEPVAGVGEGTGLMLCLHNWGGVYDEPRYRSWCRTFAERYDVVTVSVNYLQSGAAGKVDTRAHAYDFGYLQAMDCLGALYHVREQLVEAGVAFDEQRVYSMGGSGGGNVTQMVCKLAPHTFACGVDICGMPGLIDAMAFGTGEGTHIDAGYSREPDSAYFLTRDMRRIRDFGDSEHCRLLAEANPALKIVIVHGVDDASCPVVPKMEQFARMTAAGLDVDGRFLTEIDVDGYAVTTTGHPVGNRDRVVMKYADDYLLPEGRLAKRTAQENDFQRGGIFEYPGDEGVSAIDFDGYPTIEFMSHDRA
ncbi:MAG: alpha/beta hydrolase family protein [Armatimonadota bacterium]|jgi:poly(3-hydroxybutyrate) depolymerase